MEVWAKNGGERFDPDELKHRKCWAGLDLSSKIDITAFVKLFEPDEAGGRMRIVPRFWMPADTIEERADRDRMPFRRWVDEGCIEVDARATSSTTTRSSAPSWRTPTSTRSTPWPTTRGTPRSSPQA